MDSIGTLAAIGVIDMRKLIYLVFQDGTRVESFTRFDHFSPERWSEKNSTVLREMGIKEVKWFHVRDDYLLPWEEA